PSDFPATGALDRPSADEVPAGSLRRSRVRQVLGQGLGSFLQRIELADEPVFLDGKFYGWRIAALRGDPGFWRGVDLRADDVVVRVNGKGLERPDDAHEAFRSLDTSSELLVEYERGGVRRELRYAIFDDEPRGASPLASASASGSARAVASASASARASAAPSASVPRR
ncbi:MAG: hypothetical protein WCI05_18335, partial [Myxococcales bacterium]